MPSPAACVRGWDEGRRKFPSIRLSPLLGGGVIAGRFFFPCLLLRWVSPSGDGARFKQAKKDASFPGIWG